MKKLVIGLMTLALTVGLSLSAMAGDPVPSGVPLPAGADELEAWELVNGNWVSMVADGIEANAKAWRSDPLLNQTCNKTYWNIPVTVYASVAQWVEFSLTGTRWDWRVRKPGTYATDCIAASMKSNGDVEVDFEGFENLLGPGGVIPIWYAYGEAGPGGLTWITAADLNVMDAQIQDSVGLHAGVGWKLWNKIEVGACDSACEYEDDAIITLVLMNAKCWIDETGKFLVPQP